MAAGARRRITDLPNRFNSAVSTFDVDVFAAPGGSSWVVIHDLDVGPTITNTVETACPQIAGRLGLDFAVCLFFEHYDRDPSAARARRRTPDRIVFDDASLSETCAGVPIARGHFRRPASDAALSLLRCPGLVFPGHVQASQK
jgi:hypothetical protein